MMCVRNVPPFHDIHIPVSSSSLPPLHDPLILSCTVPHVCMYVCTYVRMYVCIHMLISLQDSVILESSKFRSKVSE